jgi:hypothetical protein
VGDVSLIPAIAARYPVTSIAAAARQPEVEEPGTGQVLVRYPELRIRPHTTHKLEPPLLALAPFMVGETVYQQMSGAIVALRGRYPDQLQTLKDKWWTDDSTTETLAALTIWRAELDETRQDPRDEIAFQTQLND